MVIDATTPISPDTRGHYGQELDKPQGTDDWGKKLAAMVKDLQK